MKTRTEKDSIGTLEIPENAHYGIHTARANQNFAIINRDTDYEMIKSIVLIKKACAIANRKAKLLSEEQKEAIVFACDEVLSGKYLEEFTVDSLQGGAGTSVNMSVNEIITNLALEHTGRKCGDYSFLSPLDHVNEGQSTNDVIPSAARLTTIKLAKGLIKDLKALEKSLLKKAKQYNNLITVGRTQLQDAVPMLVSQRFNAFATAVRRDQKRIERSLEAMHVINLGGTAIGTGINADTVYFNNVIPTLSKLFKEKITRADDLFDATQNLDEFVEVSGAVKCCAVNLAKMANDLRLLSSGPKAGLSEIRLPAKQNGSSIMPGKVNPVIPEVVNQAAFLVMGHDHTITSAAAAGQLELNAFGPVIFDQLFEMIEVLSATVRTLTVNCINDLIVRKDKCEYLLAHNATIATALNPYIGYQRAADIAKRSMATGESIKEIVIKEGIFSEKELKEILNPKTLTNPHK